MNAEQEKAAAQVIELFKRLDDTHRAALVTSLRFLYCLDCGRELKGPNDRCHCENDE